MKNIRLALGVAILVGAQMCLGQMVKASDGPPDAGVIARQLVEDVKNNRPVQAQALRGRDDVLTELREMVGPLDVGARKNILSAVLNIGVQEPQQRWVRSSAVTAYLVDVAVNSDHQELRERAADLLVEYVPDRYITVHAAALVKAAEDGKLDNALLLGKTNAEEAKPLLAKEGRLWSVAPKDARAALAKLGDTSFSKSFIDAYQREQDGEQKARLAERLGYIGDAACVLALARDMRTPIVYNGAGVVRSLRVDIVMALGEAYPQVAVLQKRDVQGHKEIDEWYDAVEKWLEGYLGITWSTKRPEPLTTIPLPTPEP